MAKERSILVLGTCNRKKGLELAQLFGPLGLTLVTLADCENPLEVVEDGETFTANAALKATLQAKHLGAWVLGEDSGLQVDALQGAPGVYSARFSGPGATDSSNNQLLLEKLDGVGLDKRTAGYVCHMTLSDPGGTIRAESEAYCRGRIALQPRGTHGFGYDPLFEVLEYHRTFGELGPTAKAILSHRARAARRLIPALVELLDSDAWGLSPPEKQGFPANAGDAILPSEAIMEAVAENSYGRRGCPAILRPVSVMIL